MKIYITSSIMKVKTLVGARFTVVICSIYFYSDPLRNKREGEMGSIVTMGSSKT
jgi:hypothetical protein